MPPPAPAPSPPSPPIIRIDLPRHGQEHHAADVLAGEIDAGGSQAVEDAVGGVLVGHECGDELGVVAPAGEVGPEAREDGQCAPPIIDR